MTDAINITLSPEETKEIDLLVCGMPDDLDELYGMDYDELAVEQKGEKLIIQTSTPMNRRWAEYLICRAEDIATWTTCPERERPLFDSIAAKIEETMMAAGYTVTRWWSASPSDLKDFVGRYDQLKNPKVQ
jgi:hypothetical protein